MKNYWRLVVCMLCVVIVALLVSIWTKPVEPNQLESVGDYQPVHPTISEEVADSEPIADEVVEQVEEIKTYLRDDIELDYATQKLLHQACEESGVEYELALAVIWRETMFRNVMGDNGDSYGYMQVQQKWHEERMERLGVTDLLDPLSNFRVGCDILSELIEKYGLEEGLTAYNRGKPGKSTYATTVLDIYDTYKNQK